MKILKAIVYLESSTIGKIAQATGMHRQSVKIIIEALIKRGLIKVEEQGNKLIYSASDLDKMKQSYLSNLETIKNEIPSLKADYEETKDTQKINSLCGKLGLRSILMDEIIKGKEIRAYNITPLRKDFLKEFDDNDNRRGELGIPLRLLTAFDEDKKPLCKMKRCNVKSKIDIFVYGNKVSMLYDNFDTDIFTIKIEEITKLFKDLFNNRWNKSR
jgi:sugar-specific transcriptional regulator TrmB